MAEGMDDYGEDQSGSQDDENQQSTDEPDCLLLLFWSWLGDSKKIDEATRDEPQ
jgi:hypothetical protein